MPGESGTSWFDNDLGPDLDDELEMTNYLLLQLVKAQTDAGDPDLGYYEGGQSSASVTPNAVAESEQRSRVHYGKRLTIATDDTKEDPQKVALPFRAQLFDFRDWAGDMWVAFRDPADVADDTVWMELNGSRDDATSEVPAPTGTIWLASPDGTETTPLVDAYLYGGIQQ